MAATNRPLNASYNGLALRRAPDIFRSLDAACRWTKVTTKATYVVMGTAGEYLVVCGADMDRLLAAGFERP